VRTCLLEERAGEESFSYAADGVAYTLKWALANEQRLLFVAVYQRVLTLTYVEGLLSRARAAFVAAGLEKVLRASGCARARRLTRAQEEADGAAFDPEFRRLLAAAETRAAEEKRARAPPAFGGAKPRAAPPPAPSPAAATPPAPPRGGAEAEGGAFDVSKLSLGDASGRKKGATPSLASAKKPASAAGSAPKAKRVWDASGEAGEAAQLDFSGPPPDAAAAGEGEAAAAGPPVTLGRSAMDVEEEAEEEEGEEEEEGAGASKRRGWLASALRSPAVTSLLGKASLEAEDLGPILEALKLNLLKKNVAAEIADKLCDSVARSMEGRRLGSFTSLAGAVRAAMEAALTRILTPTRSVDILRDVDAARARAGRPYVVVFVGVNGVGKSTNLAKIAYWLGSNGKQVMIAACDTFRSGAVEQLRTHCNRLGVPLFERGYAKDPAGVASEAVRAAAKAGCDVLLVDTAGRMQDNEPLMRSLSKLINVNRPDLTLFVGEALVGNDAVDQLSKFNSRLADLAAEAGTTRLIDGIVLTKFDTIDDKVGAALSMVYTSGAPVMFVGTGQTYTDLKRFNVKTVVRSLLT